MVTTSWWVGLRLSVLEAGVYSLVGDPDSKASGCKILGGTAASASAMGILDHLVDRARPGGGDGLGKLTLGNKPTGGWGVSLSK